jgi:hypothetical protein
VRAGVVSSEVPCSVCSVPEPFGSMAERPQRPVHDTEGERVRRVRLRADGQRPMAVNLEEAISLTRTLFELRDAARRSGERTIV